MKWNDVKEALEWNGTCSIDNYILTLIRKKDKIGRTLTEIDVSQTGIEIKGFEGEFTEITPGFKSFQQLRYWLAKKNFIED